MENITTHVPEWFTKAINTPYESRSLAVEGCLIHYLCWGKPEKPGLLMIHGNGAHAHWWDFIAPFFLEHYRVAAIDLSGMGDSGHRNNYSPELFAKEVICVGEDAGFSEKPILIGHSFGGFVALNTAHLYREKISGILLVDSPVRPPNFKWEFESNPSPKRPKQIYEDFETAKSRFRLVPEQPCEHGYILEYIAEQSLMEIEGGWTWKFDNHLYQRFRPPDLAKTLANLTCRIGVIYGEKSSLFSQEIADYMFKVLDHSVPFVSIPEAYHHLLLDQPLVFISALRALLAEWRHSQPQRL